MTLAPTAPIPASGQAPAFAGRRSLHNSAARAINRLMLTLCWISALATIAVLFFILGYILYRGFSSINLTFFTSLPHAADSVGGMRNCIAGTLVLIGMASCIGIPLGMLCGIYLAEYARENFFTHGIRLVIDVLAGVPSILVGVLAYGLVVKGWTHIDYGSSGFANFFIGIANFFVYLRNATFPHGPSAWAGAVALGFMMCPIIARTTEEMLKLVPKSLREASIGLGGSKFQTLFRVVIPAASSGIITGIMLAIARIAGETAPLLFTVSIYNYSIVNFTNTFPYVNIGLNREFPTLTAKIFEYASSSEPEWIKEAWAGMLVLIVLVLTMNIAVRFVTARKQAMHR